MSAINVGFLENIAWSEKLARKHDIYILSGMSISQALIEVNPVFRGNPVFYAFEAVTKTW